MRLKRIVARQALDNELLREINSKNGKSFCPKVSSEVSGKTKGGSFQRRACVVVGLSRSLVRYAAKQSKDEAELIKKIHKLAIRHSRYGYWCSPSATPR